MEQLTQMELLQINELMGAENLAVKKYHLYAGNCHDEQLKALFRRAADVHRMHLEGLIGQLKVLNGKAH